jgi:hypothetical protein
MLGDALAAAWHRSFTHLPFAPPVVVDPVPGEGKGQAYWRQPTMKKKLLLVGTLILLLSLLVPAVLANSVHLKGGKNAEPAFTDNTLTLTAAGALSGLGNGDVLISIDATAFPTAVCINPGSGEHQPPGQNPAEAAVSGSQFIPEDELTKNGNLDFGVTTDPPETPIPGAPDCPNPNWTEEITDMAFTGAVITVEQPIGTVVLTVSCNLDPATANGAVDKQDVTCQ